MIKVDKNLKERIKSSLIYSVYVYFLKKYNRIFFILNAKFVLHEFIDVLDETKKNGWLIFGSLLGSVRNNFFLDGELDIDYGMLEIDADEALDIALKKKGFKKLHCITSMIQNKNILIKQKYKLKGVIVDISFFQDDIEANEIWTGLNSKLGFVKKIFPRHSRLDKVVFEGVEALIPSNYHENLQSHYGDKYLIPDKNWKFVPDKNIQVIDINENIFNE